MVEPLICTKQSAIHKKFLRLRKRIKVREGKAKETNVKTKTEKKQKKRNTKKKRNAFVSIAHVEYNIYLVSCVVVGPSVFTVECILQVSIYSILPCVLHSGSNLLAASRSTIKTI